jgi:hypothetical protein
MASKKLQIKNCKCGEVPGLIERGFYSKISINGSVLTKRASDGFSVECIYCGANLMFRSIDKKTAIETWNNGR